ncbi:MAG: hypothetical protein ABJZ92_00960, partial [Cyclobacteriaceae bacterium]
DLVKTMQKSRYEINKMPAYKGDASLRKSVVSFLDLAVYSLNNDYKKIVDLEEIAEESYDAMEAYLLLKEKVNEKSDSIFQVLKTAETEFASKYDIKMVKDDSRIAKKLNNGGEVIGYYNDIFLLMYKSQWYERQMLGALEANDFAEAEQYRQTLELTAKEDMERLKLEEPFNGDSDLIEKCHRVLEFLYGEAVRYMPDQINFFLVKDEFEDAKKTIESKSKRSLTQSDVDDYNQKLEKFNAAVNEFNETNSYLNKHRSKRYDEWTNSAEAFFDKYI